MLRYCAFRVALLACFASISLASVIFPLDTNFQTRRLIGQPSLVFSRRTDDGISDRRRRSWASRYAGFPGVRTAHLAFFPYYQASVCLSLVAALGYVGQKLQSESVKRAVYFWFHAGPVVFHYKFARWHLSRTRAPLQKRDFVYNSLHDRYCQRCLDIALHLRGLYVKIAQIVSSRPDFVPPQYIELFTTVQDSIPQSSVEEIVAILDRNLRSELGHGFNEVFESIDPVALGSASIGQVHQARLRNNESTSLHGGDVAVKVMHNGAEDRFHHDFRVFRYLCKVALSGWEPILDECYRQIMNEFDYRKEADSLQEVRDGLGNSRFSKLVSVPRPFAELCTKEILVMEMLHGKKLSDALEEDLEKAVGGCDVDVRDLIKRKRLELILGKEKMLNLGYAQAGGVDENLGVVNKIKLFRLYSKAKKYIDLLVDVQGHQMLSLGCFNGDPHPGNLLILNDGRLGLIDFGQTKRITDDERLGVARVVEAVGNGESNANIADAMRRLGFRTKLDNDEVLARYAALFFDSDSEGKQLGCATPQMYFSKLNKMDQLIHVPDVAIFVARSSFIIRGMGTLLGKQIRTASRWQDHASRALRNVNPEKERATVEAS